MKKRSIGPKARPNSTKEQPKKQSKHKQHKETSKKKVKSSNDTKCQDYIIYNGTLYQANTITERDMYQKFIHKIQVQNMREVQTKPVHKSVHKPIQSSYHKRMRDVEEIARTLTKSQKIETIKKLQAQLQLPPRDQPPKLDPLQKLDRKLEKVKMELHFKWEAQSQKITQMYYDGTISENSKNQKIRLMNKLKDHKVRIVECTRDLFEKILKGDSEQGRSDDMDGILKSLNSFETFPDIQNAQQMWDAASQMKAEELQMNQMIIEIEPNMEIVHMHEIPYIQQIQAQSPSTEQHAISNQSIDRQQNSFNQSHRSEQHKKQGDKAWQELGQKNHELQGQISEQNREKQNINNHNHSKYGEELIISPVLMKQQNQSEDDMVCEEPIAQKLRIPMLMTRDKVQQLELQKKVKEIQIFRQAIERRIAIQLSCLQEEGQNTFTTLADINGYIVHLYQFITRKYCDNVVMGLNIPYGKSVVDKIYNLQNSGTEYQEDFNTTLVEEYFTTHHKEMALTIRKCCQYQKIHSKAVFDSFNSGLNAYRPYFEIQGQVYPWTVSQKGITFYQINDENIQQVFEKTKIKVLESCSCLCGLHSDHQEPGSQKQELLKIKRQELQTKCCKNQIQEEFKMWDLKLVNYQTMCRLILAETIFTQQLMRAAADIRGT